MAKAKKDDKTQTDERAQLGSDEQAHPDVDHSHAGYLTQEDADIRLQRAHGDSRASTPQE